MKRKPAKPTIISKVSPANQAQLQNTLGSLVQGAFAQTNLTSFNPIIQNNIYAPLSLNWQILTYMYKTHGIIQAAIDMPVMDALRGGLDITSPELDADDLDELNAYMEESGLLDELATAMSWARLYGGAGLILNTDQDASTPFNPRKINRMEAYAADRWELTTTGGWKPGAGYDGLVKFAPKDSPYFYFYGSKVDASRVILLSGKPAPNVVKWQLAGWGMSEVEKMVEDFNKYLKTSNVLYELLEEAKIDVYRLKNFNAQLASAAGTQLTERRVQLTNQLKNFNRAIVMDMDDEFQQKQITFSGLAEVMKENRIGMASALRIPMTKLFGLSASGFNSGEDDIENYNAMVESEVRRPMRKAVKRLLDAAMLAIWGETFEVKFQYKPLRVMGSVDMEAVATSKQNRYVQLYSQSLLTSKELGEALQIEELLPIETDMAKGLLDDHPVMEGQDNLAAEGEGGSSPKGGTKHEGKEGKDG